MCYKESIMKKFKLLSKKVDKMQSVLISCELDFKIEYNSKLKNVGNFLFCGYYQAGRQVWSFCGFTVECSILNI